MGETLNIVDMTGVKRDRTAERWQFLLYMFTTALEHDGYGWFEVEDRRTQGIDPADAYAVITEYEEDKHGNRKSYRIDLGTIARGLSVIRAAFWATHDDGTYMVNAETFERLGYGGESLEQLKLADRTNGADGDYDVISALNTLECGVYGRVVYS